MYNFQNQFYFRIDSNLPLNLENEKTAGFKGFKLSDIEDKMGELNSFKIVFFVYKPHKIRKKQKKKMMGKMEDNNTVDGMWVGGLPNKVNLIISGQEYVTIGQSINLE